MSEEPEGGRCGCRPICRCYEEGALRIWREEARSDASEALKGVSPILARVRAEAKAKAFNEAAKFARDEPCEGHHHGHKCAEYIADELRDRAVAVISLSNLSPVAAEAKPERVWVVTSENEGYWAPAPQGQEKKP